MGHWHKTCALSNLPIYAGEETYVFVIERNTEYGYDSGVYTHHMFHPCLLPFEATYNDYGAGEDSKGVGLPWVIEGIKKYLVELEQGKNQYHDIPVKRDAFDVELLYEAAHEGRLTVQGHGDGVNPRLHFVMMRKDIVEKVLSEVSYEQYNSESRSYTYYKFSDILDSVDEMINHSVKYIAEAEKNELIFTLICSPGNLLFPWKSTNHASNWLRKHFGDWEGHSRIFRVGDAYAKLLENGQTSEARGVIVEYLKGACIEDFMGRTRRMWAPPSGEGSQDSGLKEHKLLASITTQTAEKLGHRWD